MKIELSRKQMIEDIVTNWSAPTVAHTELEKISGGMLHPKTVANANSAGDGPGGRVKVGRRVGYLIRPFAEWYVDLLIKGVRQ